MLENRAANRPAVPLPRARSGVSGFVAGKRHAAEPALDPRGAPKIGCDPRLGQGGPRRAGARHAGDRPGGGQGRSRWPLASDARPFQVRRGTVRPGRGRQKQALRQRCRRRRKLALRRAVEHGVEHARRLEGNGGGPRRENHQPDPAAVQGNHRPRRRAARRLPGRLDDCDPAGRAVFYGGGLLLRQENPGGTPGAGRPDQFHGGRHAHRAVHERGGVPSPAGNERGPPQAGRDVARLPGQTPGVRRSLRRLDREIQPAGKACRSRAVPQPRRRGAGLDPAGDSRQGRGSRHDLDTAQLRGTRGGRGQAGLPGARRCPRFCHGLPERRPDRAHGPGAPAVCRRVQVPHPG